MGMPPGVGHGRPGGRLIGRDRGRTPRRLKLPPPITRPGHQCKQGLPPAPAPHLAQRVGQVLLGAQHVRDPHQRVVDGDAEVVHGQAVGAQDDKVAERVWRARRARLRPRWVSDVFACNKCDQAAGGWEGAQRQAVLAQQQAACKRSRCRARAAPPVFHVTLPRTTSSMVMSSPGGTRKR